MVIPVMDIINDSLDDNSKAATLRPSIHAAAKLTKLTLNKYYEKTDLSNTYQIAMVLHPMHKLVYFKNAGWEVDLIDTCRGDHARGVRYTL